MLAIAGLNLLAVILFATTPWADWNSRHLHNPTWPGHAKYHAVGYTLWNMGAALLTLVLVNIGYSHHQPSLIATGCCLLGWSALILFLSSFFPGTVAEAEGERMIRGWPVSLWAACAYLLTTLLCSGLALFGAS